MSLNILVGLGKYVEEYVKKEGIEVERFPENGIHYTEYAGCIKRILEQDGEKFIYTHSFEFVVGCVGEIRGSVEIDVIRCEKDRVVRISGDRVRRMIERDMEFR